MMPTSWSSEHPASPAPSAPVTVSTMVILAGQELTIAPRPMASGRNGRVMREGPFWDLMAGRSARPPAPALLGWELVSVDPEAGTIEVAFTATEQFLNSIGVVQGGLLAAMLDATLGSALLATLDPGQFAPTTDLHAQFLRPARPGRLTGRGRVVRRGKDIAFMAGELVDDSGQMVAAATSTAQIRAARP